MDEGLCRHQVLVDGRQETREAREEVVVVPIVNIEKRMLVKGLGFMVMMKVKECTKGVSKPAIVLQ